MKQNLLKKLWLRTLMLVAILLCGAGSAWGETKTSTLNFTAKCEGLGTADDGALWTITSDASESTFDNTKGIHYGTNSSAVGNITLTTSSISGTITKVVVNASTASGVTATVGVTVAGNQFGGDAQSISATATDYTFEGSAQGTIVVTVAKPSKVTKALYVKSIVVTYEENTSDKEIPTLEVSGYTGPEFVKGWGAMNLTITTNSDGALSRTFTGDAINPQPITQTDGTGTMTVNANSVGTSTLTISVAETENYEAKSVTLGFNVRKQHSTVTLDDTGLTNTDIANGTEAGTLVAKMETEESPTGYKSSEYSNNNYNKYNFTWSSSNENVATVEFGTITLVGAGTTTISVKYANPNGGSNVEDSETVTYKLTVTDSDAPAQATATFNFSEMGYENGEEVTTATNVGITVTFDKGTNNNAPKYYTTGTAVRAYGGNTFTISSENTITNIELTFSSGEGTNEITTDVETYSNGTWTGSAESVTFTIDGTTGHRRIAAIKVTYIPATPLCATPTFSPLAGTFTEAQSVAITCATAGATIYYTTDGAEPTAESTEYTAPIAVGQTTTIKAIAVAEGYDNSAVASATYAILNHAGTQADPYTVADARAAIDASDGVTGVYATGIVTAIPTAFSSEYNNITFNFVDESGDQEFLQAYRCSGDEAANVQIGDIVVVYGNLTKYNSTYEFASGCQLISRTPAAVAQPTFSPAAGTYTGAQTVTIACETEGATIKYSFDNETWQDYSAAIQLSEYGTFTIYAKAVKGTDESAVASATYTIEDPNAPGTENNPYTVAQARAAIDAGTGITGVYVKGIVSGIVTAFNSQYGNISFNISDDGTTTADQLEAYRCFKGAPEVHFTSEDDIQVGDEVVLFGNLVLYKSTYELSEGNYLVSLNRHPSITLAESSKTIYATLPEGQSYNTASIELTLNNCDGADLQIAYCDAEGNIVTPNPYNSWITVDINEYEGKYYVSGHAFESNTGEARTAYAKVYVTVDGVNYYSDLVSFTQLDPTVTFELAETSMSFPAEIVGGQADMRASFVVTINNYSGEEVNVAYCDAEGNIVTPSPYTWITIAAKKISVTGIVFQNNTEETPRTAYAKIYVTVNGVNYYSDLFSFTQEGAGSSAGEDVVIVEDDKTTFLFNTDGNEWGFPEGSTNKTVDENTFTANGVSITLAGSQGNGYYYNTTASNYLILGKAGAYLTLPAFDFAVGKIVVEGNSGASPNVVQNIFVGENAVSTQTTGATMTNSYVIADEYQEAGNIYTLKVLSAHNTQISKIIVYNATGEEKINPQLKYSATAATATLGEEFTAPTLSYLDGFDGTITYASDNEEVATIDNEGVVSLVSAGTAVITASFAGNDTYEAAVARYTLTVQNAAVIGTDKFELVADASTLAAGDVIILVGTYEVDEVSQTYALGTNQKTNNRQAVAVTINSTDGTITPSSDVQQITLEEGWYFNVGNGYLYAASKSSNYLKTETEADDNAKATISTDDDGNATIIFQGENTRNELRFNYNTGDPLFACYAAEATTGTLSHIYKKVTTTPPTLLGDVNGDGNVTIADVTALVNIILGKDDVEPYKYNHDVADVNDDKHITIADVTALVNIILGKNQN